MKHIFIISFVLLSLSCKKYNYTCTTKPRVVLSGTTSTEQIEAKRMTIKQAQRYQADNSDKDNIAYCQIIY